MKRFLFILIVFLFSKTLLAEHITGGEMYYRFDSLSQGKYYYHVTLKLFRDCNSAGAQLDASAGIGIFNKSTGALVWNQLVPMSGAVQTLQLNSPGPCITNPPVVCYQVGYYEFDVSLSASADGYTIAYQRCCRINGISNIVASGNSGATYTADIPGNSLLITAPENNSAKFTGRDTVIVCGGYPFTYNFGASDADGDQLKYSFCEAYMGGSSGNAASSAPYPPANPPYTGVTYNSPYNSSAPLGSGVSINPSTGLISGTSPPQGIYVVTVCVQEIRNGVVIATQRKDLQIKAGGCDLANAQLDPFYTSCDDLSYSFTHPNNPLITSFDWNFGDPASGINNTSALQNPSHDFSAPGDYTIKLITNRTGSCSDSATAVVRVWPGFFPDFTITGVCITNPIVFHNTTTASFGSVNSLAWNFADETTLADTSSQPNPSWRYATIGTKDVQLIATSTKGCIDTMVKQVIVIDKPPITLAFNDTLICVPDAVQLQATGRGNFSWTPLTNIINFNSGTPTVNPTTTTTYTVQLNDQGCINTDMVTVRVVTFVTLNEMNDTTICQTDQVQLQINSDGLQYQWTPAAAVNDPALEDPIGISGNTTTYTVTANIGSCTATKNINVLAVPYPIANAGPDTTICYNTPAFLHGLHDGSSFSWMPTSSLQNSNTLNPIAYPPRTTNYILSSSDTRGCPKPGRDTVIITVLDKIIPYAGNDTLVIVGQPLQLNAEGGTSYLWIPSTGLNNPAIKNPIGIYGAEIDSVRYIVRVYNNAGCYDSASVKVTVFKTNPYVFVPTGFTPNDDGLNDVVRPIAVGVERINFFKIYNRWGQLVFSTTKNGHGWDGKIGGVRQGSNVYVWMVGAIDYTGKSIFLKGTVTLIR